ncbi:thioredoxin domain-containing protein [Staphylococcus equorum]|uniref:thioredoxin domain-containing protein n=1 Tax=Staphylococcus equorum TaxID=246432 RepID=UPI00186757E2|nr:DsbA family protein [Staphylococcus equorum]
MNRKTIILTLSTLVLLLCLLTLSLYFFLQVGFQDTNSEKLSKDTDKNPTIGNSQAPNTIVEFTDFKCPYCKNFHESTFEDIKKIYIDNGRSDYRVVNASILGEDSIKASRASHAINLYYPKKYEDFHNNFLKRQPKNGNKWITDKIIDKELSKLNIPSKSLVKIKTEYKTRNSKAWKLAKHDKKLYEKYNNEYVPSIYVNGKFIKEPNNIKEFHRAIEKTDS